MVDDAEEDDDDDDEDEDDDDELPLLLPPLFVVVPLVFPLLTCKATVDGVVEVDDGFIMFNGTFLMEFLLFH